MPDDSHADQSHGAVFLSYASQDGEAARRICEALRSSGIEVWFDRSELSGGDAWDQSIRKQIKNCALFIPIISRHTQTRLEGYFRLEWKLAEDRSHLMAKGKAFIVPVSIDDTGDQDAEVPDSFLAVQWTRLPGGETPPAFAERLKMLLAGRHREADQMLPASAVPTGPLPHKALRKWKLAAVLGVAACLALAAWRLRPKLENPSSTPPASSESQQLVAKAWQQLNKTELGPDELALADGFCKRAVELDPESADAWAAFS